MKQSADEMLLEMSFGFSYDYLLVIAYKPLMYSTNFMLNFLLKLIMVWDWAAFELKILFAFLLSLPTMYLSVKITQKKMPNVNFMKLFAGHVCAWGVE